MSKQEEYMKAHDDTYKQVYCYLTLRRNLTDDYTRFWWVITIRLSNFYGSFSFTCDTVHYRFITECDKDLYNLNDHK